MKKIEDMKTRMKEKKEKEKLAKNVKTPKQEKSLKGEKPIKEKPVKEKKPKVPKQKPLKEKNPKQKVSEISNTLVSNLKDKFSKEKGAKTEHTKSEIPFYRSIAIRLIAAFLVPVVCVLVLGIISYTTASNAIVNTYKNSVQQTADTMQQYVALVLSSEQDEFKTYLAEKDLTRYFDGRLDNKEELSVRKTYQDKLRSKMAVDTKIHSAFFLADDRRTIDSSTKVYTDNLYSNYIATAQGEEVANNPTEWFIFGQEDDADAAVGLADSSYCIRVVKKMSSQPAIMMINISSDFIRDTMQSLDPGEGGYVSLITSDGKEFYADAENIPAKTLVYGTDFYKDAVENENMTGNEMVKIDGKEYMFVYSKLETGGVMITALVPSKKLLEQSADIQKMTTILTIICAIVALAMGTLISRQMSGTIQYIMRQLRKVAKGDLTVHLKSKRKDEFGLLCDGVNDTVGHVKSLIRDVNDVSQQVGEAAIHVAKASGTFMETSQNIQDAVIEIEHGVNKLDTGSDNCLSQMDSLSGKINNVSSNADELEKLTNATGQTIATGISSVQSLTQSSEITANITREVIQSIQELAQKSKSISSIVSVINDIAEQTNLLSLNASIEAARAGEAGRGFSVVAEEIRKLADQCIASAGQISKIVDEIVGKTIDVVGIARKAEEAVSSQATVVDDTTDSFRQIDKLVAQLIQALQIISNNVQEMNGARNETLSAIESISDASTQTAECSSSVHMAAGTQMDAVKNLDVASQSLTAKAESLLDALSSFQVE